MKVLPIAIPPQEPRPATRILHATENARIVAFTVAPGQAIAPHVNAGTVTILVTEGTGVFSGGGNAAESETVELVAGEMVIYEPNETHAIASGNEVLRLVAFISTSE